MSRYERQIALPEVGVAKQNELYQKSVLIVGAGGLGSPVGLYLAGAGVGTIYVCDHDKIERSNLHRQIIHNDTRVGQLKSISASISMGTLNPKIGIASDTTQIDEVNAAEIIYSFDLVLDCTDNYRTRYLISDACKDTETTCVYGAVGGWNGELSVFKKGGPCYRCVYPDRPERHHKTRHVQGIMGPVCGVIGSWMAVEAMKELLGVQSISGKLQKYEGLAGAATRIGLHRNCANC